MKKLISITLQFLLFLCTFALGSFARPFHLSWDLGAAGTANVQRSFVPDGILLMLGLYLLVILIEALTKHLRTLAPGTTLALLLAAVLGYTMKLGFITRDF